MEAWVEGKVENTRRRRRGEAKEDEGEFLKKVGDTHRQLLSVD